MQVFILLKHIMHLVFLYLWLLHSSDIYCTFLTQFRNNNISTIPVEIGELSRLGTLDLHSNQVSKDWNYFCLLLHLLWRKGTHILLKYWQVTIIDMLPFLLLKLLFHSPLTVDYLFYCLLILHLHSWRSILWRHANWVC